MVLREQDKHFLWSLVAAVGVVFVWKGLWEGAYVLADTYAPMLSDPFVFLFIGLAMLTLSGLIFHEFDPLGSMDKSVKKIIHKIVSGSEQKYYEIKYRDNIKKKDILLPARKIFRMERDALIFRHEERREEFIPFYRIVEILYKGKTFWRL